MALARVSGVVLWGVVGTVVEVEVEVAQGLPSVGVVGLPDASVGESRWRARSAVSSIGATWPAQRVTISLTPAEMPKNGSALDLPIAVGVLLASGQGTPEGLDRTAFIGELGLDGALRPTRGAVAGALAARQCGMARVVVPVDSAPEISRLPGIAVLAARDLADVMAIVRGEGAGVPVPTGQETGHVDPEPDLAEVRGHEQAKFALEAAAAGGHHVAMVGPPGVGKTLLAHRLPGLLPDLDDEEAIEVAAIHSVAGLQRVDGAFRRPPTRSPHHSASAAALLGSATGRRVQPGAATLSHRGVLFLDEAAEFARPCLEGLRQPMESGVVWLQRAAWAGSLPARFMLVLAANPCPCGLRVGTGADCSCSTSAVRRYTARLSGPVMDRVDVRLLLIRPSASELDDGPAAEPSGSVRLRVATARARGRRRMVGLPCSTNAEVPTSVLRRWPLDSGAADLLHDLERRSANLRGPDRVLRVAWSLADLAGRDRPSRDDVAGAMGLRGASLGWTG
ncbi:MAG: YifB family Mg chelatase-like AAA ATPase [Actinomycetota bacterium]|nr:YifB family Mg chelatase-like AAA ATPase [Actinomycetota bacterium]